MADVIQERSQSAHERSWSAYQRTGCDAFGLDEFATFWLAVDGLQELMRRCASDTSEEGERADYSVAACAEVIRQIDSFGMILLAKERELPLDTEADWSVARGAWEQWRLDHVVPLGLLHDAYQEGDDS